MSDIREFLDKAHEIEQKESRLILRKEFVSLLPEDMEYSERRVLIKAWQQNYFRRLNNIGILNLKG